MTLNSFGKHFIVGLSGTKLSDLDKKILSELSPAGVLLLKRNFLQIGPYHEWLEELRILLHDIHEHAEREKMIISIDHEGGRVLRTPPPITKYPEPSTYKEKAYEVGKAMGVELSSIGVNVSWSPSCDVNSNPNNPVIGKRAFSDNASEVSNAAIAFLEGLKESNVFGCAKHFPGHGDTSEDSHISLPLVTVSKDTLESRELIPFKNLINSGLDLVMTAHVVYPAWDSSMPATLSQKILQGILRNELGFKGCVVTDDLDMKAISDRFTVQETITHALTAGCDFFIVARYPDGTSDKPLLLAKEMSKVKVDSKVSEESFERVEEFLRKLKRNEIRELSSDVFTQHGQLAQGEEQVCRPIAPKPVESR